MLTKVAVSFWNISEGNIPMQRLVAWRAEFEPHASIFKGTPYMHRDCVMIMIDVDRDVVRNPVSLPMKLQGHCRIFWDHCTASENMKYCFNNKFDYWFTLTTRGTDILPFLDVFRCKLPVSEWITSLIVALPTFLLICNPSLVVQNGTRDLASSRDQLKLMMLFEMAFISTPPLCLDS